MTRQTKYFATLIALFGIFEGHHQSNAFVLSASPHSSSSTALHLVPGQGGQLVAAYNAARIKEEASKAAPPTPINPPPTTTTTTGTTNEDTEAVTPTNSRNLIQRAFSLPSSMIKRHPLPNVEGLEVESTKKEVETKNKSSKEDIVYYPVVGFTFCKNGDRVIALPTKSNVSCRLPTSSRNEEVFGWYSPVCKLDMYSEDPCHEPNCSEQE